MTQKNIGITPGYEKYLEADKNFHYAYATNGTHGDTLIKELAQGKDALDPTILVDYGWVTQRLSHLEGQILTVIEATVTKDNQKPAKDIVKNYVGAFYAEIVNTTHTEEYMDFMCKECSSSTNKK